MRQPGPRRYDLHTHSRYSDDGTLAPAEILAIAKKRGLSGLAVTDHGTIRGGAEAQKLAGAGFEVVVGAELMTDLGEVIGLYLTREITAQGFAEVVAEIHAQGGLAVIPHPFDALRRTACRPTAREAALVDAIEGFNARCILNRYNGEAARFAREYHLPIVGGSDAHFGGEIGQAGVIVTQGTLREGITGGTLELFGRRAPLLNHARTKIGKLYHQFTG
jgi:predicted metal-dependent phosphoesterase TrpH